MLSFNFLIHKWMQKMKYFEITEGNDSVTFFPLKLIGLPEN